MDKNQEELMPFQEILESKAFGEFLIKRGELESVIYSPSANYYKKLQALSKWYKTEKYAPNIDWNVVLTPIEFHAYALMLCEGMRVKPQYPLLNYHLDFAIHDHRVNIELDGKDYHKDREKDLRRDSELREIGWTVYRIPGSEIFRTAELPEIEDPEYLSEEEQIQIKNYFNTGEGIIRGINMCFKRVCESESHLDYFVQDSLRRHQLFKIQ